MDFVTPHFAIPLWTDCVFTRLSDIEMDYSMTFSILGREQTLYLLNSLGPGTFYITDLCAPLCYGATALSGGRPVMICLGHGTLIWEARTERRTQKKPQQKLPHIGPDGSETLT